MLKRTLCVGTALYFDFVYIVYKPKSLVTPTGDSHKVTYTTTHSRRDYVNFFSKIHVSILVTKQTRIKLLLLLLLLNSEEPQNHMYFISAEGEMHIQKMPNL